MNDLEKLITDLSNYWDLSPEKVVDRLNHMNESEIKNVVSKMTKKFEKGGLLPKAKFEDGGIMKCLRGGKTYSECKKCGGSVVKAEDGEKVRRTDRPGNAWTLSNGIDVLTQDAVGVQPLPGSYSTIPGSTPEWETWRTVLTNKGGDVMGYNYDIYLNDGDHIFSPVNKYTTKRMWNKPSTWLRRELTPERAAEMKSAYDANKLQHGGLVQKAALGDQIGGKISKVSRSTMFDDAAAFMPEADRKFVRTAYRTAKNHGRDLGLRGWSLRNWSKNQVSDRFRDYADQPMTQQPFAQMSTQPKISAPQLPVLDDIVIEDDPITINDVSFDNLDTSIPSMQKIDRFGGNFNSAFRAARNSGLSKFYWTDPTGKNSGWKTTNLATDDPIQKRTGVVQSISQQAAEGAQNAVKGYKTGSLPGAMYRQGGYLKKR